MKTIQIVLAGALALGTMVQAQPGFRQPNNAYRNGGNPRNIIDQVLNDLNRAGQRSRLDPRDFGRVTEISRDLQEFQFRWSRGNFDKGKLDRAIGTLQKLADSNRLPQQLRSTFYRDVTDLRQFRATRGGYNEPYSYRR